MNNTSAGVVIVLIRVMPVVVPVGLVPSVGDQCTQSQPAQQVCTIAIFTVVAFVPVVTTMAASIVVVAVISVVVAVIIVAVFATRMSLGCAQQAQCNHHGAGHAENNGVSGSF